MEVLFASNNIADWSGGATTSVDGANYDNTHVPYAISVPQEGSVSMLGPHLSPSGTTVWYHWRGKFSDTLSSSNDGEAFFRVNDTNGDLIASSDMFNGQLRVVAHGGSSSNDSHSGVAMGSALDDYDLKVDVTPSVVTVELYLNGSLLSSASITNSTSRTTAAQFSFIWDDTASKDFFFSEFVAAAVDTRGIRLTRLDPETVGAHADWDASLANLVDDNRESDIRAGAADLRQSASLETYSGGNSISALVVTSIAAAGPDGPQTLHHSIRSGGTDYDSAGQVLEETQKFSIQCWETDPSDDASWTDTKINAIEVGLKSAA